MDGSDAVSSKQMAEEMCAIETLPFVTKLRTVAAKKDKVDGFWVSLSCYACREHDISTKKAEESRATGSPLE